MTLLWLSVFIVGSIMAFIGTFYLSQELSKKSSLKQSHIIPDFLLFDCEAEVEIKEDFKNKILKSCLDKTSGDKNMDILYIFPFFETKEDKMISKDFILTEDIYKAFLDFNIKTNLISNDNSLLLNLHKNTNIVELSSDIDLKDSFLEVNSYNKKTNLFKLIFRNIQLEVSSKSISKQLLDLENGKLNNLRITTNSDIKIKSVKNIIFKTKMTEYFRVKNIKEKEFEMYDGELQNLLR